MELNGLFNTDSILLDIEETDTRDIFRTLVETMKESYEFPDMDTQDVVQELIEREREGTTGIGGGIAIPHVKTDEVDRLVGGFARTSRGVDFRAVDGKRVDLFFLILSPEEQADDQLQALKTITNAIKEHPHFNDFLQQADSREEIIDVFEEVDEGLKV